MNLTRAERRAWIVGAIFAILFVLFVGIMILIEFPTAKWVGRGDLTIEFVVVDAETGKPIPNLEIEILELDHPPNPSGNHLFNLVTDDAGIARTTQRVSTAGDDYSLPFFTDTYHAHLPGWLCRVRTETFDASETLLYDYRREQKYLGSAKYLLRIPVRLRRSAAS